MARGMAKLGRFLYERVQNVSQNLTKEKVKNELAWMAGNAAIGAAAKALTSATLAAITPAAAVTVGGLAAAAFITSSIRHVTDNAKAEYNQAISNGEKKPSKLRLLWKHANEDDLIPHIKTKQFWGRTFIGMTFSGSILWGLENTTVGQNVAEHAGKAFQKTTHWLSDRANAVFSMFHRKTQLDLETIRVNLKTIRGVPQLHPAAEVTTAAPPAAPAPVEVAAPTAIPAPLTPEANASNLITKNGPRTPQQIKDYAYNLLNGKNGVTADPETAIELYKEAAQMGNLQARADLAYLASQKDYKDFGLTDYLKNHPTPATHPSTTGTADAKHLAPKKPSHTYTDFKAQKPIEPAVKAPPNVSAETAAPQTLKNRAPAHITTCTNDVSPERVEGFLRGENDNIISVDCNPIKDASIQMAQNGDFIMLNGTRIEKDGPPELAKSWITRATATVSRMDWGWLEERFRSAAAKLATQKQVPNLLTASPSPAPVALARVAETPENWLVHNIQ